MAVKIVSPRLILISIIISLFFLSTAHAGGIVTYWGQNRDEGTLTDACNSGLYEIVNIAFLSTFGKGQNPQLNLAGHCDAKSNQCQIFSSGVRNCQSKNVKVLLSIGGETSTYSLSSADEARSVADYIWNNFLGGKSGSRPLGDAVLDGVDFDIETGEGNYYADLAKRLLELSGSKKLYLTAAPQCPGPNIAQPLRTVFSTRLHFDYVWIQFYNNPMAACQFSSSNPGDFQRSWNQWTSSVNADKFYAGFPASPGAAKNGYVPVQQLVSQVLPFVRKSSKYGGIMVWNRLHDAQTGYSSKVKGSV